MDHPRSRVCVNAEGEGGGVSRMQACDAVSDQSR